MKIKTLTSEDDIVSILTTMMNNKCKVVSDAKRLRLEFIDQDNELCYSVRLESLRIQSVEFRKKIKELYGFEIGKDVL